MLWLTIPLLVIGLSLVVLWTILYIIFSRSPEKKWRDDILKVMARAKRRAYQEQADLSRLESDKQQEATVLWNEDFSTFLSTVPTSELDAFPGIGQGTIDKLQGAGYSSLESLQRARIQIYGIGQKGAANIYHAVHDLTSQKKRQFASGDCPQAQALNRRLIGLDSKYERLEREGTARVEAVEGIIRSLQQRYIRARNLTLVTFWTKDLTEVLPAQFLNQDLPDLNSIMNQAEENAIAVVQPARTPAAISGKKPNLSLVRKAPEIVRWENHLGNRPPVRKSSTNKTFETLPSVIPVLSVKEGLKSPSSNRSSSPNPKSVPLAVTLKTDPPPSIQAHSDSQEQNRKLTELDFKVQFAFLVARLDGPLVTSAKNLIYNYFHNEYTDDTAQWNRAQALCAHYEKGSITSFENRIRLFQELFTADEGQRVLRLGARILQASSRECNKAGALLQKMAGDLKISFALENGSVNISEPPTGFLQPHPTYGTSAAKKKDDYLRILDIDPSLTISADLVRRQFNHYWEKFIPEKAASLGADVVQIMENKRQEVKMAATALLEELGEKLELPNDHQPKPLRENRDLDEEFGA